MNDNPQVSGIMAAMKKTILVLSLLCVMPGTAPVSAAVLASRGQALSINYRGSRVQCGVDPGRNGFGEMKAT
jgi:hypothetical protein